MHRNIFEELINHFNGNNHDFDILLDPRDLGQGVLNGRK